MKIELTNKELFVAVKALHKSYDCFLKTLNRDEVNDNERELILKELKDIEHVADILQRNLNLEELKKELKNAD